MGDGVIGTCKVFTDRSVTASVICSQNRAIAARRGTEAPIGAGSAYDCHNCELAAITTSGQENRVSFLCRFCSCKEPLEQAVENRRLAVARY